MMEQPLSLLLAEKNSMPTTVNQECTVFEAVCAMNRDKAGAVIVTEGNEIIGIFTERDVLVKIIGAEVDPKKKHVKDVMTSSVQTVPGNMRVAGAMKLMSDKGFRHLPVVDDNAILGIITIGDLTSWVSKTQEIMIRDLENYIKG